ncbi:MAG: hypothetical protein AAF514_23715, partial [Verrucomicrobiota bacterium]
ATTEPNKILPTILSRCQRFDLRRIPDQIISDHLLAIAEKEGINLDKSAARTVAKGAEGGMRDAQSMLDQLVAFCGETITEEEVLHIFGFTAHQTVAALTGQLLSRKTVEALEILHQQAEGGKDLSRLLSDLISYLRTLLVFKVDPENGLSEIPDEDQETVKAQAGLVAADRLMALIELFAQVDSRMKWAPRKKLHFEIGIIKAVQTLSESNLSDVINALSGLSSGEPVNLVTAAPPTGAISAVAVPEATPIGPPPQAPSSSPVASSSRADPPLATDPIQTYEASPSDASPAGEMTPSGGDIAVEAAEGADSGFARLMDQLQHDPELGLFLRQALQAGHVEEKGDGTLTLSFAQGDALALSQVEKDKRKVETALSKLGGKPVPLILKLRDKASEAEPNPPTATGAPPVSGPPASEELEAPPTPVQETEETFYNDPLIEKALELFEATIEKKPPN